MALLKVQNLGVSFFTKRGIVHAVNGVSFSLERGEALGIIGESGCGKSVTAQSILRLVDYPGRIVSGSILFKDRDVLSLNKEEMRSIRGREIGFIPQDPTTSLNPVYTVGYQIKEKIKAHTELTRNETGEKVIKLMKEMWIPAAEIRVNDYPFQFSGGMCQRVTAAVSLSTDPSLAILDEPTTALDVTTQDQLLKMFISLQESRKMGILFITHDFSVLAKICDRVAVMYAGRIVETANIHDILETPYHPYTKALISCVPRIDDKDSDRLGTIIGQPPTFFQPPIGCVFKERCSSRRSECDSVPPTKEVGREHFVSCWCVS